MTKPKLAIYGDSFASLMPEFYQPHTNNNYVWYKDSVLTENYDITNYGEPGIDFMYCYHRFIDTHHNYDNVVFVVTAANRLGFYYKNNYLKFSMISDVADRLKTAQRLSPNDNELHSAINAVEYYFKYYLNTTHSEAAQATLIEKIQEVRPDAVVVYGFENSFIPTSLKFNLAHLSYHYEIGLLNPNGDFWQEHGDMRNSHMTAKNNEIFANYISNRLKGLDVNLTYDDFKQATLEEKHMYYIDKAKLQDILNERIF
jgi:hypothetical protein